MAQDQSSSSSSSSSSSAVEVSSPSSRTNYYSLFHVHPSASVSDIRHAYQKAALALHPDKMMNKINGGVPPCPHEQPSSAASSDRFLLIQEAWETLRDPIRRKEYDAKLAEEERIGRTGGGFVSEDLDVGEMEEVELLEEGEGGESGREGWSYPCRCGEAFHVLKEELPEGSGTIVNCDGCSLRAKIRRPRR